MTPAEFDKWIEEGAEKYSVEWTTSDAFKAGANLLLPLLLKAIEQLKDECCCPGERSWTTGEYILCDACEFLKSMNVMKG